MQYLIMALETPDDFAARQDPDRSDGYWASWMGYLAALTESGVLTGAGGLHPPSTSTTVRTRDGQRVVQDGPYADTKEQTEDPALRQHLLVTFSRWAGDPAEVSHASS